MLVKTRRLDRRSLSLFERFQASLCNCSCVSLKEYLMSTAESIRAATAAVVGGRRYSRCLSGVAVDRKMQMDLAGVRSGRERMTAHPMPNALWRHLGSNHLKL